jgi:hypothetical protein
MSESVRNLINAIATGSAVGTEEQFNAAMAEKISVKLDAMRQDVAANMFATEEVEIEETVVDENYSSTILRFTTADAAQKHADKVKKAYNDDAYYVKSSRNGDHKVAHPKHSDHMVSKHILGVNQKENKK